MTRKLSGLVFILGIICLIAGIVLWQNSLNKLGLLQKEPLYPGYGRYEQRLKVEETSGLILFSTGAITIVGGGLMLLRKHNELNG